MTEDLTKDQQTLLWELFAAGGAKLQAGLFKKAGPKVVAPLVASRHVRVAKQGRANLIEMQDDGWRWVADSEPFPVGPDEKRVGAERRLLASLVGSVKRYAKAHDIQIQDMFRPVDPSGGEATVHDVGSKRPVRAEQGSETDSTGREGSSKRRAGLKAGRRKAGSDADPTGTEERIRSAFFGIAGRPARDSVRLSALRAALPDLPRAEVDRSLLAMRKSGTVNLMNLDNPRDVAAETEAALKSGKNTFHVVRIDA